MKRWSVAVWILLAGSTAVSLGTGGLLGGCGSSNSNSNADANHSNLSDAGAASDMASAVIKDFTLTDDIGSVSGIACGDTPCAANAQFCCTATQGKTGLCGYGTATDCASSVFYCDGPEDCPPAQKFCCVSNGVAQCVSDACPGTNSGGYGMCHLSNDCTLVGGTCCPSSMGGPYRLCLPNGCL